MLSTYLSYNQIASDMSRSLKRIASDPVVARDAQYYRENIGKITNVDDFLDDYRLFSYAMKAHGLEEMTYARAFMREVLTSDLSDEESFANKLDDERYRDFAAAFDFGASEASARALDAQSDLQEAETIGLYSRSIQEEMSSYSRNYAHYKERIGAISSVDEFVADSRLVEVALASMGLETRYYSASFVRNVLVSDPDDPNSFANQLEDGAYAELARLFNFEADGSLAAGVPAQDAAQIKTITDDYIFDAPGRIVPQAAQMRTDHFRDTISGIQTLDELMADRQLVEYLITAYDLPATFTRYDDIRAALTSDLSDPNSFANTATNTSFRALAELFNFQTDGTLAAGDMAQTVEQTEALTARYLSVYADAGVERDASRTATFKAAMATVETVEDLVGNRQVFEYALKAYGLDPDVESRETIRRVLTSDLSDPTSYANRQRDPRYRELAAAFNFDGDGNATTARVAQSQAEIDDLSKTYLGRIDQLDITKDEAEREIRYYREQINLVESLDDFLADDRLVGILLDANGIERTSVDKDFLRDVFTSDLQDRDSFVNTLDDRRFRLMAARFNFEPDGKIARADLPGSQSDADLIATQEFYLRQTLEEEAGAENEGVRLALYFRRMAGDITNAYDILADPALQEVARVALGLPKEMAASDLDAQARAIEDRIDLADFTDPEKVENFISRFSALYDLENGTDNTSMVATLFGNVSGSALGADMLMSLSRISRRPF